MVLKASQIRNEKEEELTLKLRELRKEIFQLRGMQIDNKNFKPHLIGQKRKEIARMLTCQNEKKRARKESIK